MRRGPPVVQANSARRRRSRCRRQRCRPGCSIHPGGRDGYGASHGGLRL